MDITFAQPKYLLLLMTVPFVVLFAIRTNARRRNQLRRFASDSTSGKLKLGLHPSVRLIKWSLICLVYIILVVALAQPHYRQLTEKVKLRNVDIFFLLDVSGSMLADDVKPAQSRLHLAKRKIRDIGNRLAEDRIGLIVFSRRAYVLCPLTIDKSAFDFFLDDVNCDTISSSGTNIAAAISKTIDSFNYETLSEKIIILVSDGEEPEKTASLLQEIRRAANKGIRVFALGIGSTRGTPIEVTGPDTGEKVVSAADFSKLASIAEEGNGIYANWRSNDSDVIKISDKITEMVGPTVFEFETRTRAIEFSMLTIRPFQILLFFAIFLLCAETFLKN